MQLLEWAAMCGAVATLAWSAWHIAMGELRDGLWADLVVPIAMLAATAGIALGICGDGPLWGVGGAILLTAGCRGGLTLPSVEMLFAAAAPAPPISKPCTVSTAVGAAAAVAVFAIA